MKIWGAAFALMAVGFWPARAVGDTPLKLEKLALTVGPGRGSAVIGWNISTLNRTVRAGIQLYLERTDATGKVTWDGVVPETEEGPVILSLERGKECSGRFTIPLERGSYGGCRLMLFESPDGTRVDSGKMLFDSAAEPATAHLRLGFVVVGEKRLLFPVLSADGQPSTSARASGYTVTLNGQVTAPTDSFLAGYTAVARCDAGIVRTRVSLADALPSEPGAETRHIPVRWTFKGLKPGVWSVQLGLARGDGEPRWLPDRVDFEVGGAANQEPPVEAPAMPRLRVRHGRFETLDGAHANLYSDLVGASAGAAFLRGGNYGNAICWTAAPALNRADYFRKLRELGCRFMRVNFSADRYLTQDYYPRALDGVVRNIWAGGMYPLLAPQDMPRGATERERIDRLEQLLGAVTTRYKGMPLWLEVLNEPSAFPTWAKWRPVAVRMVRAIRAVDPDALVVVPFEGWTQDGRGAAANPIMEVRVDLYDGHAYVKPEELAERFAPAIRAGLPVMLGEFGGGADYLRTLIRSIQKLPPGLVAIAPWAFTQIGQDSIPLVETATENEINFTAAGKVIAQAYRAWNAGRRLLN